MRHGLEHQAPTMEILTFFDALPYPVLFSLSETCHTFRVPPPNEICFFQLAHECLFAGLGGGW